MQALTIVVATDLHNCIGKDGAVPWSCPADMKHFRATTLNHAIIMGRATYASIGKPLPKRRNIMITRGRWSLEGVEQANSLLGAIQLARLSDPEPMVIGGGQIYAQALSLATKVIVTRIRTIVQGGDTWFPELTEEWNLMSETPIEGGEVQVFER